MEGFDVETAVDAAIPPGGRALSPLVGSPAVGMKRMLEGPTYRLPAATEPRWAGV